MGIPNFSTKMAFTQIFCDVPQVVPYCTHAHIRLAWVDAIVE